MRLFEGTVQRFKDEVVNNRIADILSENYSKQIRKKVSPSEYRSWEISLRVLKDTLDLSNLLKNKIIVEYRLPYSERRIDVLLFGQGRDKIDKIVLIELKQWSNENVYDCDIEGNIEVNYGNHRGQQAHPCLQVEGYVLDITDFLKVFSESPKSELEGCSYCHNYRKSSDAVLLSKKFAAHLKRYPLFTKEDTVVFGEYLKERLSEDSGFEVFNRFIHSKIGPSKKLLDHTGEMIHKQQIFSLIDDQIAAYNAILDRSKKQAMSNKSQ